jgi:hypothetical protein
VFSTTINGVDYLIKVTGASTETIRVLRIRVSDGAETTIIDNTQITENILYGAMGGNDLMLVTPTKVWRYSFDAASPALHQDYAINTANAVSANIGYVKQRFILGISDTNKNTFVYELNRNTGSSINLSTLTPVNGSTTLPIGFTFTAVTESSGAIYVGGYSGDQGLAFKITVDNAGSLSTMSTVLILPRGEILTALYGYLGTFVMIGTDQGVRVAVVDDNYNLSYGPIIFETTSRVYSFTARDEFVWAGVAGEIDGYSGLIRFNLGSPLSTGGYAYAKDIYASTTTGSVWSIATLSDGRKAFTVENSGLWIEEPTKLVESGQFTTGIIRFDTFENKAWKRLKIRFDGALQGSIDILRTVNGVNEAFKTVDQDTTAIYDYDLASVFTDVQAEAQFTFRLNRNDTDTSLGATILGYSVKALPTPTRARVLQIPIFCFDKETDRNRQIVGYEGYALSRIQALEQLEAQGQTIIIQDFTAGGEPTEAVVEQVTFTRTTPPQAGFSGYGGIVTIVARTVV